MSDLRTEIVSKVLNQWDNVATTSAIPSQTAASETISEKIFNFIQAHPSCTSTDVVDNTNVDLGRASATLLSLYQKGKVDRRKYPNPNPDGKRDHVFVYWTTVDSHKEKGVPRLMKPKKQKKPHVPKALKNLETPELSPLDLLKHKALEKVASGEIKIEKGFNPEMFVQDLSLKDAKAVYEVLKGYFQ
jgi:hypothetical protein